MHLQLFCAQKPCVSSTHMGSRFVSDRFRRQREKNGIEKYDFGVSWQLPTSFHNVHIQNQIVFHGQKGYVLEDFVML